MGKLVADFEELGVEYDSIAQALESSGMDVARVLAKMEEERAPEEAGRPSGAAEQRAAARQPERNAVAFADESVSGAFQFFFSISRGALATEGWLRFSFRERELGGMLQCCFICCFFRSFFLFF